MIKYTLTTSPLWFSSTTLFILLGTLFLPGLASWEQRQEMIPRVHIRKQRTLQQDGPLLQTRPGMGNYTNLSTWIHEIVRGETPANVFFQHFRKAGGTSFCRMARQNMLASPTNNCNLPKDDKLLWQGDPHVQRSIPSRFPQWNFLANEGPMADDAVFLSDFMPSFEL